MRLRRFLAAVVATTAAGVISIGALPGPANAVGTTSITVSTETIDASTSAQWTNSGASEQTGASAFAKASFSNGSTDTPSGTVTYSLFQSDNCNAATQVGSTDTETVDVLGNVPNSMSYSSLGGGTYTFQADYSGDAVYVATSTCGAPITVSPVTLTIPAATPDTGSGVAGAHVTDSATLDGQVGIHASGTVTYQLFQGTCASLRAQVGSDDPVTINNTNGTVPDSSPFGPLAAGPYVFEVTYGGDSNYSPITTPTCEALNLSAIAPGVTTTVKDVQTGTAWVDGGATEVVGQSAYDTTTITGQVTGVPATGTVTYQFFSGACGGGTQIGGDDVEGITSGVPDNALAVGPLGAGSYHFTATYSGDANYTGPVTAGCEGFSVARVTPTLSTTPHKGTGVTGARVTDSATLNGQVSGFHATGTVTYQLFNGACQTTGTQIGSDDPVTVNADGTVPDSADLGLGPLAAGSYAVEVTYGGDTNYAPIAMAHCEDVTIGKATLTLGTTPNTGSNAAGATVSDSASLDGQAATIPPSGTVTYKLFHGTCSSVGAQVPSTDPVTVNGDGTVPDSSPFGPLAAGPYVFEVTYGGDTNYSPISTPVCEPFTLGAVAPGMSTTVKDVQTQSAWVDGGATEVVGQSAKDTASITGQVTGEPATGTVTYQFFSGACGGGTQIGLDDVESITAGVPDNAQTVGPLNAGIYHFTVTYNGDTNYSSVSAPCEQFTVAQIALTLSTTPHTTTGIAGATAFDTVTLSPESANIEPTGTITYAFFTNTTSCTGSPSGSDTQTIAATGTVPQSKSFGPLSAGNYSFGAVFNPADTNYTQASSNDCEAVVVGRATPTTPVITNLPGGAVAGGSFTAIVATNGDGIRSVSSQTPAVCTVGADGLTVTYAAAGNCTLNANVGIGHNYNSVSGGPQTFGIAPQPRGYWLVGTDGGIFSFGAAAFHGSMGGIPLQRPVVGITPTASRNGYWLVATDGGIFAFGDSSFYGSIPGLGLHPAGSGLPNSLNAPIVGMVPSSTGHGYFMVASDGGVFAFGDARFEGSCPGIGGCFGTAVAVMPDHSGNGYWLVTSAGAVYAFGDAPVFGSQPGGGSPVVSAVATPDGQGYWIVDANGSVWAFGNANAIGQPLGYVNVFNPATAIFSTSDGRGYWVAAARGDVFSYGDAPFLGSMSASGLNGQIIAGFGF